MKNRVIRMLALCTLLAMLAGCGKTAKPAEETAESTSEAESTSAAPEEVSWDDGDFLYLKGDMPKGWTIDKTFSTSTYLEARYGKEENAPKLTVSVMTYNDDMGAEKSRLLADAVHEREKESASEVAQVKIGGLDFYHMSYNSLVTEKTRCYIFFGQNAPDKNKEYKFVEIQMDNIKDAKQYDALKGVLDQLSFKF